ncbi:hypothetical protein [Streptomyces specialis]|uniref:hypothetical protein n=1 Tax=Streptomyces specialis TaxID=498367 RepID=UPI000AD13EAD|nr:hypothetical protein [Streptomyces specialis]
MIALIAAFALLGLFTGTAAHVPPAVSLVAGGVIACWLAVLAYRERRRGMWW